MNKFDFINTKKENAKAISLCNISNETAKETYKLSKAFETKNREAQAQLCSKLNLNQSKTFGCWKHSRSFGELIVKIYGAGYFKHLCSVGKEAELGVFHKTPIFDPKKGWIQQKYIQIKDLRTGKYIPWKNVLNILSDKGEKIPEDIINWLYTEKINDYIPISDIALEILVTSNYKGVLPKLDRVEETEVLDENFSKPKNFLKECLSLFYEGGYITPPAMDGDRYNNALEPEVWEQENKYDPRWDSFSIGGYKQGKAMASLLVKGESKLIKQIQEYVYTDKPEQAKFWFERTCSSVRRVIIQCADLAERDEFLERENMEPLFATSAEWKTLFNFNKSINEKRKETKEGFGQVIDQYLHFLYLEKNIPSENISNFVGFID